MAPASVPDKNDIDQCRRCPLWERATQGVAGEGPRRAALMLVGEQPGDQEDREGHPFVGPAGRLLRTLLGDAHIAPQAFYLTNAVKHFSWEPRGTRRIHKTPAQREIAACSAWLDAEVAAIAPRVIVALGATALRALLGTRMSLAAARENSAFGTTFSAVVAGMKTFFPDLPLNSGFYRPIEVIAPEDTVVNARWPIAVTGFLMPFEKIMNSIYEIWSKIMPERAIACAFNLEYLLTGGRDLRSDAKPIFMFYDWLPGGWGGRNGRDGCNVTTACFGTGLQSQPVEGQERVSPILTNEYQVLTDSPGPGKWRGGAGVRKTTTLGNADRTVISYICDRERAIVWGINGGLPSMPHGLSLRRAGSDRDLWLGSVFSDLPLAAGDVFSRPTAGGGGYGDPLERDPALVREDVADDYVSLARARTDYGVVLNVGDEDLAEYAIDHAATERERAHIRAQRRGWLATSPDDVARRYQAGDLDRLDVVRQYGVILDWGTGEVQERSTVQFRDMFQRRAVAYWKDR